MPAAARFSILAPLDPIGSWRRSLALDGGVGTPRAVVLSFAPEGVADDPARLAAIVRDAEAAGRLHHQCAVPVLGTETMGGGLVIVEPYRPGATVRSLVDAGGRLPGDVAARVVVDACAAIARAHAVDAGGGKPLVHGALGPGRISIGEDGAALVSGFAVSGGGDPARDVRALAAVLHECLTGDPPGDPPSAIDAPGVAAPLAAVIARALGAGPGAPFQSAAAFGEAVAAAGPVAAHAAVAAYADAILPRSERSHSERGAQDVAQAPSDDAEEVVAEDLVVDPTEPGFRPPGRPAPTRPMGEAVATFRAPPPSRRRSRLPVAVFLVCVPIGFAGGFAAARLAPEFAPPAPSVAPALPPSDLPAPVPAPAPPPAAPRRALPAPALRGAAASPAPSRAAKASSKSARRAAPGGKGFLDVTAPDEAEVFLDGRRIGKGTLRVPVVEGAHRIEVRLGAARVTEKFTLAPGETWTYAVTPDNQ